MAVDRRAGLGDERFAARFPARFDPCREQRSLRAAAPELGQRPTRADPAHPAGDEQRPCRRGLVSVEGDETVPALAAREPLEQGASDLGRPVGAQKDVRKQVGSIG